MLHVIVGGRVASVCIIIGPHGGKIFKLFTNNCGTRHFQGTLCIFFQTSGLLQNLSYENEFDLQWPCRGKTFSFFLNGFAQRLFFDTETKGNLEMADCFLCEFCGLYKASLVNDVTMAIWKKANTFVGHQ